MLSYAPEKGVEDSREEIRSLWWFSAINIQTAIEESSIEIFEKIVVFEITNHLMNKAFKIPLQQSRANPRSYNVIHCKANQFPTMIKSDENYPFDQKGILTMKNNAFYIQKNQWTIAMRHEKS